MDEALLWDVCVCVCAIESPQMQNKGGCISFLAKIYFTTNLVMVCKIMSDFITTDREV